MVSNLSDSYILHLQPPHFLTESGEGVHLWQLEEEPTRGVLTHSLNVDTFSLELGVLFHPFCALTISTNVANWHDGWAVQVWNFETQQCVRRLPAAGYITDIRKPDSQQKGRGHPVHRHLQHRRPRLVKQTDHSKA